MAAENARMDSASGNGEDAGFAKLQGEDFDFFMQSYEIILGRNTKRGKVDFDLSVVGGGMDISRCHARIFYDFQHHWFALEVLGKNGCIVEMVLYLPGDDPVKLKSQDLIQIGETKFYFLLPTRSIFATFAARRTHIPSQPLSSSFIQPAYPHSNFRRHSYGIGLATAVARHTYIPSQPMSSSFTRLVYPHFSDIHGHFDGNGHGFGNGDNRIRVGTETQGMFMKQNKRSSGELDIYTGPINVVPTGGESVNKEEIRSADKDTDNQQLLLKEETDFISSIANLVSNNCGPREWMPVEKLHLELIEHFSKIWPVSKVQKYLTPKDGSSTGTARKPWHSLLELLRKYPEHFVISTISRGTATSELFRWSPCRPRRMNCEPYNVSDTAFTVLRSLR